MDNPVWRIEAHIWFRNFDEYAKREKELLELLGRVQGNGSVTVFFRTTEEYLEIPGASYDYKDDKKVDELIKLCGKSNIDFVARISQDIERKLGCIRGKKPVDSWNVSWRAKRRWLYLVKSWKTSVQYLTTRASLLTRRGKVYRMD